MCCYVCAEHGVARPAVALCRSCSAGLCVEHLRETAAQFEADNILAACRHDTWRATDTLSTSKTERAVIDPLASRLAPTPGRSRVRRAWRRRGFARHGSGPNLLPAAAEAAPDAPSELE